MNKTISTIEKIRLILNGHQSMTIVENHYTEPQWAENTFDSLAESGRSYMVGTSVSMANYKKSHSSYIPKDHWLVQAVEWAFENSSLRLKVQTTNNDYEIAKRGDTVEIALPHHGRGGEKHWIVYPNNYRKKLLVNVD